MLKAQYAPYRLLFRETAITSRQSMDYKDTYFVRVWDTDHPDRVAYGECALFRGLSQEDTPDYERQLARACREIHTGRLPEISSIRFGIEGALRKLGRDKSSMWEFGGKGIEINGLVWMGTKQQMRRRIREKLADGFTCVKMKIGGIHFADELELLRDIRKAFSASDVELRVDANGSFTARNAMRRLGLLSALQIHSIEQPVRAGQWQLMRRLCQDSPVAIALDEEIIGFRNKAEKQTLLDEIRPAYIIVKPSLCGGLSEASQWVDVAQERKIGWWATSALESDIGLAAIGRWLQHYTNPMPQGLGTGRLYTNNIPSPLHLEGSKLWYDPEKQFEMPQLPWRD